MLLHLHIPAPTRPGFARSRVFPLFSCWYYVRGTQGAPRVVSYFVSMKHYLDGEVLQDVCTCLMAVLHAPVGQYPEVKETGRRDVRAPGIFHRWEVSAQNPAPGSPSVHLEIGADLVEVA
jgi:hypothetical protein